ncbi:MAG: zinc ribbon domain-containing protein [Candidatus Marinimicrobia bacterium]|nr:zinc ribbon domain-containing protein [Candidatus Neomarinimicrobiota bacterium]
MPTYDYVCKKCGYEFEEFHSISDDPVRMCPKCGHMSVERKISGGSGLIFKGSGFYITDYSNSNSSGSSPSKSTESTSSKKSEKKTTKKSKNTSSDN